jgi:hypothetical protein
MALVITKKKISRKVRARASVAEPHHFYAAPAPGKNFDAAQAALAPASTLPYRRSKFVK